MVGGLQKFEIILDSPNNVFSPGGRVAGRVVVKLGKTKSIRGLKIRFKGAADVSWKESSGFGADESSTWYTSKEEYFRMEYYLLGGVSDARVDIETGCHLYPFTFTLPHNIPSSFESYYGNVRYAIKATMDRPWKFDHKTDISLIVQSPYDLSRLPDAQLPIQDEGDKSFGCFPFDMGSLSVLITMPASGFFVGEAMDATFSINNHSQSVHVTEIKLKLQQRIKVYARNDTRRDQRIVRSAEKLGPFNDEGVVTVGMRVPRVPPSGFPHCRIIDIDYRLIVQIFLSGCHRKIERVYPIYIGRRPARPPAPSPPSSPFESDNSTMNKPPPPYNRCMNDMR